VNGQLIWFLLRHEFRLRQRDPKMNLWYLGKDYLVLYLFLGVFVWFLTSHHSIHFFNPLPDVFPVFAGVVFNFLLFSGNSSRQEIRRRSFSDELSRKNLYAAPISSRFILASHLFNRVVLGTLMSIGLLPIWLLLAAFYNTPNFIISLPLFSILFIVCNESLSLWKTYIYKKWFEGKAARVLREIFAFTILYSFVFIFVFFFLARIHVLSMKVVAQWFYATAPLWVILSIGFSAIVRVLTSDSWLWLPGRATLLDPLPTIGLVLFSIGLIWLTIEILHRPLIKVLQTPITESRSIKTGNKSEKFHSNLIFILTLREWRHNQSSLFNRFNQTLFQSFYPCMVLGIPYTDIKILSLMLAMGIGLCLPIFSWFHASIVFAAEDSIQLLVSSPIKMRTVGWCKRLAVLIPFWISCLPIIFLAVATHKPWEWIVFFIFFAPLCQVILRSWNIAPALSPFLDRRSSSQGEKSFFDGRDLKVLYWLELLSWIILAICFFLMLTGEILEGCFVLGLEVCLIALAYRRNLQIGDIWGI
jgi:hypothetical protein